MLELGDSLSSELPEFRSQIERDVTTKTQRHKGLAASTKGTFNNKLPDLCVLRVFVVIPAKSLSHSEDRHTSPRHDR